jgi:hypothetical protein
MEMLLTTTGFSGRCLGRLAVCPRMWDIAPGATDRSLPIGWET